MDGKLPEISVLDSKCLMAGKFGTLFTLVEILAERWVTSSRVAF